MPGIAYMLIYMLIGSMAMINYAMMRMTNDIDIVMEVSAADADRIINEFEPDLPEKEFKKQLYFRTYGEHLPEDFFKD